MNDSNANAPKSSRDPNEADANPSWCDQDGCVELLCAFDQALLEGLGSPKTLDAASAADPTVAAQLSGARQIIAGLALLGQLDSGPAAEMSPSRQRRAGANSPARPTSAMSAAVDAADAASLPTGQQINRFKIIRELGRGGLGVVLLAHDPLLVRDVALKIPRPEALFTADLRRRFAREAQAAARLTHPNLVAVYEVGTTGPVSYIAAAYCPGPNLAKWLADRTDPVPVAGAAEIVAQLADGIGYAHGQGVLHRDLKPSNVMLEPCCACAAAETDSPTKIAALPFVPKITDFGLARVEDLTAGETRTGLVVGTPGYMAPEQAEGRTHDLGPATDVYGLGAILYELLVGKPVFRGAHDLDTLRRMIAEEPVRPGRQRPDLPRDLEAICLKCLDKQPARRYPSAGRLAADLRRFLAGEPTEARPIGVVGHAWKWALRRPTAAALWAVILLAASALVVGSQVHLARVTAAYRLAEQHHQDAETQRAEADVQRTEAETRRGEAQSLVRDLRREVYVKDIPRVLQLWEQGEPEKARAVLEKYRPGPGEEDLRGFEWYHLQHRIADQGRTLVGHLGPVYHVAASPDGSLLASAGADRRVQLWDTNTWKIRSTLRGHRGEVNWVSFSPDGHDLVSSSDDGTVRVWTVASQTHRIVAKYDGEVAAAEYTLDGTILVVATSNGRVAVLDTGTWDERWHEDCGGRAKSVSVAADGKEIAVTFDGTPTLRWDLTTVPPSRLDEFPAGEVVVYPTDRHKAVVGTVQGGLQIRPRSGPTRDEGDAENVSSKPVDAVVASPNGRMFAAAGVQGIVRVLDASTFGVLRTYTGHHDRVWTVAWLANRTELVSAGADGAIKVWEPHTGQGAEVLYQVPGHVVEQRNGGLEFSRDSREVWFNTDEGVWSIDLATRFVTSRFSASEDADALTAVSSALQPGAERSFLCRANGSREVWDVRTSRVMFRVPADGDNLRALTERHAGRYTYVADMSRDGRRVAAPDPRGHVAIWDVQSGEELMRLDKQYSTVVFGADFSPDGRFVAVDALGAIDLFDAMTGQLEATYRESVPPVFAPDGRFFIHELNGRNDAFRLVRVDGQHPKAHRSLQPARDGEALLTISPDGHSFLTMVPSGTNQSGLWLWNVAVGEPMLPMASRRRAGTQAAAFSPDKTMLITLDAWDNNYYLCLWRANRPD